ncbi:MAG: endonuclease domain-containing protein [Propionivibrio sp.]|uniref:endonuclease domain-containing protein n=1 Tax=Propionivibrio sp. TaxID=2212460 RepID=UPI001B685323|nr:endonuclease domain-containing protein [Propionivibrio sp.]
MTAFARANRKTPTPAETTLWQKLLRNRQFHGYKFLRQKPIGPYVADFYCAELKLVLEIDGDIHAAQEAYDAERTAYLARQGIRVLRYTNLDVGQQLAGIHDDLTTHLERITS